MLKRFIQWIVPLVVLVLIATYMMLSPLVSSHAVGPTTHSATPAQHSVAPQNVSPDIFWRP